MLAKPQGRASFLGQNASAGERNDMLFGLHVLPDQVTQACLASAIGL